MRKTEEKRKTKETKIEVSLNLDGTGLAEVTTGIGFFDHLLNLFSKQGLFDLKVNAKGDLAVDDHHTVEDVAIVLGNAFKTALGDKKGIFRYGFFTLPMDESLVRVAIDLSGRGSSVFRGDFTRETIGDLSTENIRHFFDSFARACDCTLHAEILYGENNHHKAEALFKAFGRAMKLACEIEPRAEGVLPSTKGVL